MKTLHYTQKSKSKIWVVPHKNLIPVEVFAYKVHHSKEHLCYDKSLPKIRFYPTYIHGEISTALTMDEACCGTVVMTFLDVKNTEFVDSKTLQG